MAIFDAYIDYEGNSSPTFSASRPYVAVYVTQKYTSKASACAGPQSYNTYYAQDPEGDFPITFDDITYGTRIYPYAYHGTEPLEDGNPYQYYRGILPISENSTEPPQKTISLMTGYGSSRGNITHIQLCPGTPTPTPVPTPVPTPTPTIPAPPITPPNSNIEYAWFTVLNESYSRKVFGYYSGSADFKYSYSPITGSGESGPSPGTIRLDSGSIGSGDTTSENQSKFLYIDVKDSTNQEDIISYLTNLSTSPSQGKVRLEVFGSSSYHLEYDLNGINSSSIESDGYFSIGIANGSSSPSINPFSSSYSDNGIPTGSNQPVNIKFYNDAILGYHEVELPGSGSVSFVAAIEQTSSALPSGSIPGPFNTSWGISEDEFLDQNYFPSSQGKAWMWNDGYKVKHIKMNNRSSGGDILSNFIKKSNDSTFVLYNPKNALKNNLYSVNGNYSEGYVLDNVTRFNDYSYLKVDQLNNETSFAVLSENFAQTDFNLSVEGKYISFATSSGTVTFPTASSNITSSIPQGYFPATLDTEQFFRGWNNANYYINGNLNSTFGDIYDPLDGFNSGSTERDQDNSSVYIHSTLPWFIDSTASYQVIESESIHHFTPGLTNLTQIGPVFNVVGGGQQKYFYKEDNGQIYISGSEFIDIKKTTSPNFDSLHDVELVPPQNSTTYYDTGEGFTITVKPSQSLWLSRGISLPGTLDGDLWKYNRYIHRPYKVYALTSTGSYIKGYSEELYGEVVYREEPYPVGPPANELEKIFIAYSESSANLREDGIYTFTTDLSENVTIYADVELDYRRDNAVIRSKYGEAEYSVNEYGQEDVADIFTWETASLHLYKNNSIIQTSNINNLSASLAGGYSLELTRSISSGDMRTGDKLKLSLEVENTQSGFNAAVIVPKYNLRIGAPVPPTSDLVPVTFDNALGLTDDCNPTINNIVGDRPNKRLQDVDYSVDVNSPINFDQIIKDEAVRATIPESNFTQLGFANQRYFGSSTSRRKVNEYNELDEVDVNNKHFYATDKSPDLINAGKGPSLGKEPNVELKNGYIAYFNKIIDPYPVINGKTAYYVKYLIDENGTVFDPTLSDINFSILEGTFKLQDYDLEPTRAKVSLQNIEKVKELSKLNEGISSTFKTGQYPVPILYSQTSSLGHTSNIILSGSPFFGTLGIGSDWTNYSINVNSIQTHIPLNSSLGGDARKETLEIGSTDLVFASSDVTPFDDNEFIPTSSEGSGFKVEFPLDPLGEPALTSGSPLSDDFWVEGTVEVFTTTIPARYKGSRGSRWTNTFNDYDNRDYTRGTERPIKITLQPYRNGSINVSNFEVQSVELEIVRSPGTDNEFVYNRLTIGDSNGRAGTYGTQWRKTSTGLEITPNSIYLEKIILGDLLGKTWTNGTDRMENAHFIGGGYTPVQGSTDNRIDGINKVAVIYKWVINFKFVNNKQGDNLKINLKGDFPYAWNGSAWSRISSSHRPKDWFHHQNGNGQNSTGDAAWKGTFNPDVVTHNSNVSSYNTRPVLKYEVSSTLSANNQNANGAPGPFWRRVPNTNDMLYMSSSVLNEAYAIFDKNGNRTNSSYYVQAKLDYNGDTNVVFPNTKEPDFIEFDPVQDPWSLKIGDEIRFENNENLTYTITSLNGRQAIKLPGDPKSNDISEKLQVVVTPPFEDADGNTIQPNNFDFFVVRRYKENKNFIILDQQMPYGFPVTGSLEPTSSPGILLPEHRIEKYNRNPDEVLKELIEKRII